MRLVKSRRKWRGKKSYSLVIIVFVPAIVVSMVAIYNYYQIKSATNKGAERDINTLATQSISEKSGESYDVAGTTSTTTITASTKLKPSTVDGKSRKSSSTIEDMILSCTHSLPSSPQELVSSPSPSSSNRFAYVLLVAGCNPFMPTYYLGYIYNIIVSKELLRIHGSTADMVVMIRMHEKTSSTKLPKKHENLLIQSGIKIKYIPKSKTDNFHTAMMEKFRILEMIEYDRYVEKKKKCLTSLPWKIKINFFLNELTLFSNATSFSSVLYLDADVMLLNNLDYMFHLSTAGSDGDDAPPKLAENVGIAYNNEPMNGGFFMLSPNKTDFEAIQKIIEKRELEGYNFNETKGWGNEIKLPDHWESMDSFIKDLKSKTTNDSDHTKWDFYAAFTDQGLLYHWTKYVKKNVSLIIGNKIQTWNADSNGKLQMIREVPSDKVFGSTTKQCQIVPSHHIRGKFSIHKAVPYRDFQHFKSKSKPWLKAAANFGAREEINSLWFHVLKEINERYSFQIDTDNIALNWPSLGFFPTHSMVMNAKEGREEKMQSSKSTNKA